LEFCDSDSDDGGGGGDNVNGFVLVIIHQFIKTNSDFSWKIQNN